MSFSSDPEIDKAYSPSRALPEGVFPAHMELYRDRSLEVYRTRPHQRDLRYDEASGQGLDIVPAPGPGLKPAFVFIHGGYWRMLSKNESVYMAPALNARGITLVAPDHSLAPATPLEEIVRQMRAAIVWLIATARAASTRSGSSSAATGRRPSHWRGRGWRPPRPARERRQGSDAGERAVRSRADHALVRQ
jgi:acetyl esterase/lipase